MSTPAADSLRVPTYLFLQVLQSHCHSHTVAVVQVLQLYSGHVCTNVKSSLRVPTYAADFVKSVGGSLGFCRGCLSNISGCSPVAMATKVDRATTYRLPRVSWNEVDFSHPTLARHACMLRRHPIVFNSITVIP